MASKQPKSDSEAFARASKPELSKIELSKCSALLHVSFIRCGRDCTLSEVRLATREAVFAKAVRSNADDQGFFRTKISPRRLKPAFPASVLRTESRMSLFSSLKLVTPKKLLSGSLY